MTPHCMLCGGPEAPIKALQALDLWGETVWYRYHLCQACHTDDQREACIATVLMMHHRRQAREEETGDE